MFRQVSAVQRTCFAAHFVVGVASQATLSVLYALPPQTHDNGMPPGTGDGGVFEIVEQRSEMKVEELHDAVPLDQQGPDVSLLLDVRPAGSDAREPVVLSPVVRMDQQQQDEPNGVLDAKEQV